MNSSIVINITTEELKELIEEAVLSVVGNKCESKVQSNLLNIDDAVEFLRIPKATLYQYTSKRLIPYFKVGRHILFKTEELNEWLLANRKKTREEIIKI